MIRLKIFIKKCICQVLFYTGLVHLYLWLYKARHKSFPAVIVNYHSFVHDFDNVMDAHPTVTHKIHEFEKEVRFLKKHFHLTSLDEITAKLKAGEGFSRPTVAITVDDGFQDNYSLLFPVLKNHDATATIFLTTGVIGRKGQLWVNYIESMFLQTERTSIRLNGIFKGIPFDIKTKTQKRNVYREYVSRLKNIDTAERDEYIDIIEKRLGKPKFEKPLMLNWDEVREMHAAGIHFGAHTVNHPILTNVSLDEAKQEIAESKQVIEKELNAGIKHFAFPNGRPQDFNEDLRVHCKSLGFSSVSSCDYGANTQGKDIWNLRRIGSEVPLSLFAVNLLRAFKFKVKE